MTVDHEDKKSLTIFHCHNLVTVFSFTETCATEYAEKMVYRSDRAVGKWYSDLIRTMEFFLKVCKAFTNGLLWSNEDLNSKVTQYIRVNSAVYGRKNMTTLDLYKWINK